MAKKFVKVNGLHNVFEASANIASSTIKSGASASVDANSILFITADAEDEELFGGSYPSMKEGAHYIWAQGVLHDTNSGIVNVGITGDEWIDFSKSQMTPQGPSFIANHVSGSTGKSAGINSGTTTADAGGESIQFKVPKLTFDKAGHVSSAADVTYKVALPKEGHTGGDHTTLTVKINSGTTTYNTRNNVTIDVDAAINAKVTNAIVYRGVEGSTGTAIKDGATTKTVTMSDGSALTAGTGDLIIGRDGIKEFIWNGSIWEQVGSEDRSVVSASASNVTGSTYTIGTITVNGSTTTFIGKDTVTTVSYKDSSKTGTTYEIGKITINGTTTTLIGRDNDTKYGAINGVVAQTGGTIFQADLHDFTKFGKTGVASTTDNRYYRVGLDAAGKLAVNVPWTNNHSFKAGTGINLSGTTTTTAGELTIGLKAATSSAIGGIAIGYPESGKNYPVELNSSNQAFVNVPWITYGGSGGVGLDTNYNRFYLLKPTDRTRGGIKIGYSGTGKNYPVQLNSDGQAYVSVPWADAVQPNNGTLTLKIAGTVGATHSANTSANTEFNVPVASSSAYGVIKTGYAESTGVKKYAVKLDSNNKAYVEVPWTNTTYGASEGVELVDSKYRAALHTWEKMGATGVASSSASRYYRVGLDAAGKLAVNVPWTDTNTNTAHGHAAGDGIILTGGSSLGGTITIGVTAATTTKYGGIKTNYTASGKNYPVKLDTNGNAYVNVPWDPGQNTTYKLTGAVVGTTGAAAANTAVTTAVASAVSFVDQLRLTSTTGTVDSTSTCILMNGDGVINLKAVAGKTGAIEIDYTGVATAEDWATIG